MALKKVAEEAGRTVRAAMTSWPATARLVIIMSAATGMAIGFRMLG